MRPSVRRLVRGFRGEPTGRPRRPKWGVVVDEVFDTREAEGGQGRPSIDARLVRPWPRLTHPSFAVRLEGWIRHTTTEVLGVEAVHEGELVMSARADRTPARIAQFAALEPAEGASVFQAPLGTVSLPRQFEVSINAVLEGGGRPPVWKIRGRRSPLLQGTAPRIRPVVLNGHGRTGSTWLTRLLDEHPEILVYRPFDYEPRVAAYWIEILRNLADPKSYLNALRPSLHGPDWWLGEEDPPRPPPEKKIDRTVGRDAIEELAALCIRRTEATYSTLALEKAKPAATCFVEKAPWGSNGFWRLLYELYPDTRELLLVRDVRDVVCSMLAYDDRRGFAAFGREHARSERNFLDGLRDTSAHMLERHRSLGARSCLIRYEDLVQRPRDTLAVVFEHLSVDASPVLVDEIVKRASRANGPDWHRTSGEAEASIGRWRRDMSPELLGLTEELFGEVMEAEGYERDA